MCICQKKSLQIYDTIAIKGGNNLFFINLITRSNCVEIARNSRRNSIPNFYTKSLVNATLFSMRITAKSAISLSAFLCFQFHCVISQRIQWASEVSFQFNQYSSTDFSAEKVLGPPDATPYGQLSANAFRLNTESSYGTITLGFERPQAVSEVVIIENYLPGQVVKVILHSVDNETFVIYESVGSIPERQFNVLSIVIDKTPYLVTKVAVHLNTYQYPGWSQIDAVGICEEPYDGEVIPGYKSAAVEGDPREVIFLASKERLSDEVNSRYVESKPLISPDGTKLFFARKNAPTNIGGKKDIQDIYVSTLANNEWTYAYNIGRPLNDEFPNGICSITPDGNTALLINAYTDDGKIEDGVSIARRTTTGWSFPKKQEILDYYNNSEFQDYCLSNSGKILISAVQRNNSKGGLDLYVSFMTGDNSWTVPKNLGYVINTNQIEFSPFLASDNKTLYFASEGHRGFGESDIFYSRRLDDTWTRWSVPENIGKSVNTAGWDAYYTLSAKGDYAYFISTSKMVGKSESSPKDDDIYRISIAKESRPDPVVLVKGTVLNSKTNMPVEATIYYQSLPDNHEEGIATSDPINGRYAIVLPMGLQYGFRAEAEGYIAVSQYEDFTSISAYREITQDLLLTPLSTGEIVLLNNIFFVQGKAAMLPESEPELERLVELMQENPSLEIELGGHTDNQGSSSANLRLSEERALSVMNSLIERGVQKRRLQSKGYGGTKPIASNANEESRRKNRRVEVKVLKF